MAIPRVFAGIDYDAEDRAAKSLKSVNDTGEHENSKSKSRIGTSEVSGAGCVPANLPNPYGGDPAYYVTKGRKSKSQE